VLKTWLAERHGEAHDVLFPTNRGGRLSRDTVQWLITKHVAAAAHRCPSLATKHITPHVLRHTCAMNLRQAGVDVSVIALWLGHEGIETTSICGSPEIVEGFLCRFRLGLGFPDLVVDG